MLPASSKLVWSGACTHASRTLFTVITRKPLAATLATSKSAHYLPWTGLTCHLSPGPGQRSSLIRHKQSHLNLCTSCDASRGILQATNESASEQPPLPGLYLVGTPIGNLEDITLRALRILRTATVVLAEDTRHSRKLLNHFDIKAQLYSFHQHNEHAKQTVVSLQCC